MWIASWAGEEYARAQKPEFMLAGMGTHPVDQVNGFCA